VYVKLIANNMNSVYEIILVNIENTSFIEGNTLELNRLLSTVILPQNTYLINNNNHDNDNSRPTKAPSNEVPEAEKKIIAGNS